MTGVRIEMVAQDYALAAQIVSPSGSPVPVNSFGLLGQHAVVASTAKMQFKHTAQPSSGRLNKFVRRLHDMLSNERNNGVVEWRRGLLILHSIDAFTNNILPKYFNTKNFKTFRRQLNYYGFVHLRSFVAAESKTTALWVNQELADHGSDAISSVLMLKRVEPTEATRTPKERRERKNEAASAVEAEGIIRKSFSFSPTEASTSSLKKVRTEKVVLPVPSVVHCPSQRLRSESSYSEDSSSLSPRYVDITSTSDYSAASMLLGLSRGAI